MPLVEPITRVKRVSSASLASVSIATEAGRVLLGEPDVLGEGDRAIFAVVLDDWRARAALALLHARPDLVAERLELARQRRHLRGRHAHAAEPAVAQRHLRALDGRFADARLDVVVPDREVVRERPDLDPSRR